MTRTDTQSLKQRIDLLDLIGQNDVTDARRAEANLCAWVQQTLEENP